MHGTIPTNRFTPFTEEMTNLPDLIPVFPLSRVVLLPGEVLPLAHLRTPISGHGSRRIGRESGHRYGRVSR